MRSREHLERLFQQLGAVSKPDEIGFDRGHTGRVFRIETENWGTAVLKTNGPALDPARAEREAAVLGILSTVDVPRTPVLHRHHSCTTNGREDDDAPLGYLLMEDLPGATGCTLRGMTVKEVEQVLDAISPLHARYWGSEPDSIELPRWGRGSASSGSPHARRIRRFAKRRPFLLDRLSSDRPLQQRERRGLEALLDMVETTLPSDLEILAGLDPTMIHGDLHPENILLDGTGVSIIDWQTCSFGSVLHDVVRFAGESLRGDHDGQRMRQVVGDHLDRLGSMGVPEVGIASTRGALDSSLRVLFAGLTTGYGTPDELTGHDRSVAATLASEDGLAGLMAAHFNLDITLPPAPAARKNDDHEHHDRPVRNNHHH